MFFFLGRIICRREKQFWTPCRNFSARTSNIFWLNFKSDKKTVKVFPQHQFFLELFLRTCRIQFWQTCMELSPNSVNWTLEIPKNSKFLFYSRDLFFLGMIISWREMQFWPPCRNFSAKTPNIFWLKFKSDKTVNFFPQHQIFLELFLRTCRRQFWQPCMKLPHQTP